MTYPGPVGLTCRHCQEFLPPPAARGRPAQYCSVRCRQAAHRRRSRGPAAAPERTGPSVTEMIHDIEDGLRELRVLHQREAATARPLLLATRLKEQLEALTAGLVDEARGNNVPWKTIARVLDLAPDSARRRYPPGSADEQLRRARGARRPFIPAPDGRWPSPAPRATGNPSRQSPAHRLAAELSMLQRDSGASLRWMGRRVRVSPGYLSRVMTGDRFPRWEVVERWAGECGGDQEAMRELWQLAKDHRDWERLSR
ncbi:helix-turn-helix domain-containing protein [Streptomyces boninensis]|uniref:helix-turn-helix domain-containing protein n=1 Tax=Streptomyces boninensis TaxID=2039455 RepID=UPI003B226E41